MGHAPCSGYVVKVTDKVAETLNVQELIKGLDKDLIEQFQVNIEDTNVYELLDVYSTERKLIVINLPQGKTIKAQPFRYNSEDGDCYDDLEDGEIYLIFSEEDLYTKKETKSHRELKALGLTPEPQSWTQFG